jgi:hypothetical protein
MQQNKDNEYASPEDMHAWLEEEMRDSAKAYELRLREAVGFVSAYALGKISAKEAAARYSQYLDRWGEGLFGATAGENMTDDEIIAAVDAERKDRLERVFGPRERGERSR